MDKELIIVIITTALGVLETGSWVGIAAFIRSFIKGKIGELKEKVEESAEIKSQLSILNRQLAEALHQNELLKEQYDTLMLEMKGIKENGYLGKNGKAEK